MSLRSARPDPPPAVRLKRAALLALGASGLTLTTGCEPMTAVEYGGCPACTELPDVVMGDAFMAPDVATADAPVEAAPDSPMGADASGDDGSAGGDAGEGGPTDGGIASEGGLRDAGDVDGD